MRKSLGAQRAKARQRLKRAKAPASAANDNTNVVRLNTPEPAPLAADVEDDVPFSPPPPDDILGLGEIDEEETIFLAPEPTNEPANEAAEPQEEVLELTAEHEEAPEAEEPPFDPPEEVVAEDDAPFDPPTEADEIFQTFEREEAPPEPLVLTEAPPKMIGGPRAEPPRSDRPLPPISVHLSFDRPATAALFLSLAKDRRFANARLSFGRGGLDGAAARFVSEASPDLLVLDTTLQTAREILAALDRLAHALAPETQVVVISNVNDVTLLRELSQRGVADYIMWPAPADAVAASLCRLYAETDKSRVIAVIGARGGVGASTVAMNLAWSIAERQGAPAALLDLDLPFGAASYEAKKDASIADAFSAEAVDDALYAAAIPRTPRLRILSAPAAVERALEPHPEALRNVIAHARRMSAFVVLDLPHAWNAWVKQALLDADDVLIVAAPDLASLRNADNMLKLLRSEAGCVSSPLVALSMAGVPKKPEISLKDFTEALVLTPSATFAFDPALYAGAAFAGQTIYEAAPNSKAAQALDALATQLTGREPIDPAKAPATTLPTLAELGIDPKELEAEIKPQQKAAEADAEAKPAEPRTDEPKTPAQEAPREPVRVDELPPLMLVVEAPAVDRFAEARKAAEAELAALQRVSEPIKPRRKSSGLLRTAASIIAMVSLCAWYLQAQRPPTSAAAEAPRAAVAIAPQAVLPPPAPTSPYAQALALIAAGDESGVADLRRLAEQGSALAQYRLAKFYERGEHVEPDADEARRWTERAAEGGNVPAMHDLGVYLAREGAERDDASAFRWFRQAAEYGFADSQFNLGVLYQDGRGATANPQEALFWFLLAARQNDAEAAARATALEAQLLSGDVEQARARARFFNQRMPDPTANITQSSEPPHETVNVAEAEAAPAP